MATADVILIPSSSPPRFFARSQTPVPLSSSPSLPSLRKLLGLDDTREEDRSNEVEEFKTVLKTKDGFQKSSSLLAKQSIVRGEDVRPAGAKALIGEMDKENIESKKKPKGKKVALDDARTGTAKLEKTKKRKSDEASVTAEGAENSRNSQAGVEEAPKKKKSRKSAGKRVSDEAQPTLELGKVTKLRVGREDEAHTGANREKASKASKKKNSKSPQPADEGLQLEQAPARRTDWTPLKNTSAEVHDKEEEYTPSKTSSFSQLTGSFGYTESFSKPGGKKENNDPILTRRLIELVPSRVKPAKPTKEPEPPKVPKPPKEKKAKLPRKKMTTITARATSNYFGDVDVEEPASILQYLEPGGNPIPISIHDEFSAPRKFPNTLKAKPKRKSQSGVKKLNAPVPLLPPDTAIQKLENQDFLFGTSTQLAADNSPIFIRDTRRALELSESFQDPFDDSAFDKISGSSTALPKSMSLPMASRSLWSAAAHDEDDTYYDAEVLNLADTPESKKTIPPPAPAQTKGKPLPNPSQPAVAQANPSQLQPLIAKPSQPTNIPPATHESPSNPPQKRSHKRATSTAPKEKEPPRKPHYEGFTDAELCTQIAKYGFKKIRHRKNMIALLDKCWEDIQARRSVEPTAQFSTMSRPPPPTDHAKDADPEALQPATKTSKAKFKTKATSTVPPSTKPSTETETETADPVPPPEPKRRGRPKKTSQSSQNLQSKPPTAPPSYPPPKRNKRIVDEISDTEAPAPSPPRPRSLSALPLSTATKPNPPSTNTPPPSSILAAIKLQPPHPTAPHEHPTFHTQILTYAPVSIEALTVWLNGEGLRRADEDGEVDAVQVRAWLEERGICCLWDGNGGRGRRKKERGGGK